MGRNKELQKPTLLQFYLEYHDKDLLREQAFKRRITMADIIRALIRGFLRGKKKD